MAQRLRQWRQIRRIEPVDEERSVAAGRQAEVLLGELAKAQHRSKQTFLLAARRIPDRRSGRKREVDLIVCTPQRIDVIEVKNWSGRLSVQDGIWRQTRRGGEVIEHDDPVKTNRRKRDVIVEYLKDCGIDLDRQFVQTRLLSKVVFMNPNLRLEPSLEGHPEVIPHEQLNRSLGQPKRAVKTAGLFSSLRASGLASLQRLLSGAEQASDARIPPPLYERIVTCLSRTGTWDHVHLYGTKILAGDLVAVQLGGRTYRRDELVRVAGGKPIRLKWTRGRFVGLLKALTGIGALGKLAMGDERLLVSPDDRIAFHEVGDQEVTERALAEVDQVVLG